MLEPHWTDLDLLNHLYGLKPKDAHVERCPACAEKLDRYAKRRRTFLAEARPELPPNLLAVQRQEFSERIGSEVSPRKAPVWRPAVALAALAALAVLIAGPGGDPAPLMPAEDRGLYAELYESVSREETERGFFVEVYELAEQDGLRAAEPIHELFEN